MLSEVDSIVKNKSALAKKESRLQVRSHPPLISDLI